MEDNLAAYRNLLLQNKFYCAGPVFTQNVRWQYEKNGHVLVDNTSHSDIVAAIVARVLDHRLCCDPNGNYLEPNSPWGSLSTAKFQLQLGRPIGTVFASDYDTIIENMERLQGKVAVTSDRRNFIIPDTGNKNLRFTRKIFKQRVRTHMPKIRNTYLTYHGSLTPSPLLRCDRSIWES